MEPDELPPEVATLVPKSLADVMHCAPDFAHARLPTAAELAGLRGDPDDDGHYKVVLDRWRVVTMDMVAIGEVHHILLGAAGTRLWMTSDIVVLGDRAARTKNGSLYGLSGAPADGEPPIEDLIHFSRTLWSWGLGPDLGLRPWLRP